MTPRKEKRENSPDGGKRVVSSGLQKHASKRLSVNMAEPWEARGLRSLWMKTRDVSGASNTVWTPLSLPTEPGQHTTNPRPLYSLCVKLLKSLTLANDVFVFGTYYRVIFLPRQWALGVRSLFWAATGVSRGDRVPEETGSTRACSAVSLTFFFVSPVSDAGLGGVEYAKEAAGTPKHNTENNVSEHNLNSHKTIN